MTYSVEVKAFGQIRVANIEANTEGEAIAKALDAIGYSVKAKPQPK